MQHLGKKKKVMEKHREINNCEECGMLNGTLGLWNKDLYYMYIKNYPTHPGNESIRQMDAESKTTEDC